MIPALLAIYLETFVEHWLKSQAKLDELESELIEINGNSERLQRSHSELMELQLVLEKAGGFFDDAQHRASAAQFESGPPSPADSKLLHPVRMTDGRLCRQSKCKPCAHMVGA